ncbi:MAG: hypothetical protein IIU08_04400, partial [Clostridia bacterium]|nr:hypothetical protein [Clostridia bacterium]
LSLSSPGRCVRWRREKKRRKPAAVRTHCGFFSGQVKQLVKLWMLAVLVGFGIDCLIGDPAVKNQ